jgi:hypothetical protein
MSEASHGRRAALCADRMDAQKTGERMGSRPKPPEAGARSASLEPGQAPGYSQTSQLLVCFAEKGRTCGHVGCCDQSPGRHAAKHYHATRHPIIEGYDPPEGWVWRYVDKAMFDLSHRMTPRNDLMPRYRAKRPRVDRPMLDFVKSHIFYHSRQRRLAAQSGPGDRDGESAWGKPTPLTTGRRPDVAAICAMPTWSQSVRSVPDVEASPVRFSGYAKKRLQPVSRSGRSLHQ